MDPKQQQEINGEKPKFSPEYDEATGEIVLNKDLADELTRIAIEQLRLSRMNKRVRLEQIKESEDLYFGIVPKRIRNPFNEPFPYMSGFVDYLLSRIDDPPKAEYSPTLLKEYNTVKKYTALYEKESTSNHPTARWALKDRWTKKLAIFSGIGVYSFYTESYPDYRNTLGVVDHYDFHFEPGGGGDLESHLFCGQENIFKTTEELESGAEAQYYDAEQVKDLLAGTPQSQYKDNMTVYNDRFNRHRAFGLDPETNNYTGQSVHKMVQWFLTYRGVRWYLLFDEVSQKWVRAKRWKDMCASELYPYVVWQTHEEATTLMAKSPADDARPIARTINHLLNQELYNREKINTGQRMYDPDLIDDVQALIENRPDALIPVMTKKGKTINDAVKPMTQGQLSGTLDFVNFLDSFAGQKTASSPGSQGVAEKDKKVGIFFGELQQIEERLGLYNKSYKEAWAQIAYRLVLNAKQHLNKPTKVKLLGIDGYDSVELKPEEAAEDIEFSVRIYGGQEETQKEEVKKRIKVATLATITSANQRWVDEQKLKLAEFSDSDIKEAFSNVPTATMELLSEAAQAVADIVAGKEVKLNRGANLAYMQHIIDEATNLDMENEAELKATQVRLYKFAQMHGQIVAENEAKTALNMMRDMGLSAATPEGTAPPQTPGTVPNLPAPNPVNALLQ